MPNDPSDPSEIDFQPNHCLVVKSMIGHWYLECRDNRSLAWSGSRWVPHYRGVPTGFVQVCNFTTPDDAVSYAKGVGLDVTMVE